MAGFFSELFNSFFGGDKKKPSVSQQQNSVPKAVVKPKPNLPQMDALLFRASRSFIKYMQDFIQTGKSVGLPAVRLNDDEWDVVNKKLLPYGVKLVLQYDNGNPYMWFERTTGSSVQADNSASSPLEQLMMRASKNFKKYKQDFFNGVSEPMLPAMRLSQSEWDELNRLIADQGICFVPTVYQGALYMQFSRVKPKNAAAPVNGSASVFQAGSSAVRIKAFNQIKQQYPNLSDQVIQHIVDNKLTLGTNDIYKIVRHAFQPYNTSRSEFMNATNYGSHDTDGISAFAYQHWTWSRQAKKRVPHQNNHCGYHLSLNVHVTPGLIAALDDILVRDMGRHIEYYKFPKADYFEEVQYRHDPVTIYMYDRDAATEQQIVAAVAPYVRSNEGLLGQILGPGVDINTETSNNGGLSVGETAAANIKRILDSARE